MNNREYIMLDKSRFKLERPIWSSFDVLDRIPRNYIALASHDRLPTFGKPLASTQSIQKLTYKEEDNQQDVENNKPLNKLSLTDLDLNKPITQETLEQKWKNNRKWVGFIFAMWFVVAIMVLIKAVYGL